MHSLSDLYPALGRGAKDEAIAALRKILVYLEGLPISKLPFVEMGFDALDAELIARLENHNAHIVDNYASIDLDVQKVEHLACYNVY